MACLPADDEGVDIVPAIAVGGVRDALLELSKEVGEETGSACLALVREGTEQERPSPCGHALDVFPREHRGIVVPVGVVQTEQLGALELEAGAGEAPPRPPRRKPGPRRPCATRPERGPPRRWRCRCAPRGAIRRAAGSYPRQSRRRAPSCPGMERGRPGWRR